MLLQSEDWDLDVPKMESRRQNDMSFGLRHSKWYVLSALVAVLGMFPATAGDQFSIDTGHSFVNFSVDHLGMSKAFGRFNKFDGSLEKAADGSFKLSFTIETASIDTNSERRDKHLRNADFFNANQFPEITFVTTKVTKNGDSYAFVGDLTMLGVTKEVTFQVQKTGEGKDPWGKHRIGMMATGKIKRSDFGMNYGLDNGALGDTVELMASIEGVKK